MWIIGETTPLQCQHVFQTQQELFPGDSLEEVEHTWNEKAVPKSVWNGYCPHNSELNLNFSEKDLTQWSFFFLFCVSFKGKTNKKKSISVPSSKYLQSCHSENNKFHEEKVLGGFNLLKYVGVNAAYL